MSLLEQCNFIRKLYQKKYYQQSSIRDSQKQSEQLKTKLANYLQRKVRDYLHSINKQSAPELTKKQSNRVYNFEYCNQPFTVKPLSYRDFTLSKQKRKTQSVSGSHNTLDIHQQNKTKDFNFSVLHSRESHYIRVLNQSKSKNKNKKIYAGDSKTTLSSYVLGKHYQTCSGFPRTSASQARKKATITILRDKIFNRPPTHRRDQNDVLPWNAEIEQFL